MPNSARPRRSVLYMPGSKSRALEKARSLPADGLILDLEDAVGLAEKETARALIAEAVRRRGYGKREVVVRINGLDSQWGAADLEMAAFAGPDASPRSRAPRRYRGSLPAWRRWARPSAPRSGR